MRTRLVLGLGVASILAACGEDDGAPDFMGTPGPGATDDAGQLIDAGGTTFDGGNFPGPVDGGLTQNDASNTGDDASVQADGAVQPGDDAGPTPSAGCLEGITDYKTKGKFTFKAETSGKVKMWVPDVPAGCKVPVVHLANGTGANCSNYAAVLTHLASHGFLATCYEDPNTGQGTQCIMALETAAQMHPELADDKIGSTGHSQGGGAAIVCVQRAEEKWGTSKIYAGHSMEPASGFGDAPPNYASVYAKIKSPIFMFNGSVDTLVSATWVGQAFDALADTTEAYWYEATGAAHIPVPTRWTQESTVSWFRWKLLGDKAACEFFKKLPDGSDWSLKKKQAEQGC